MPAPKEIIELIELFDAQRDSYQTPASKYNETQVRTDFINPFFDALGWDMVNKKRLAETYRDVIHEDKILVGRSTKAPDYSFRIGGVRKFFVEAKRPAVDVREKSESAYQIRRYGWSAKLPISILTNFEEFAIYDTTIKPNESEKAGKARLYYFHYKNYERDWDIIEGLLSKLAIQRGALDRFENKPRKGTETIDEAFLEDIEHWRELLAKDIYKKRPNISGQALNDAVQLIIDRIIFLRICEDRGIEPENKLQNISMGTGIYDSLKVLFQNADAKYNSGLFHFKEEAGKSSEPDTLTLKLKINGSVLKDIIKSLYYPNPYEFSVLPADILGHIYERFLGKVIRLTPEQVKIEEKPEVRKAGGVYYTPSHIVDYIIKYTIKDLLKDLTPDDVSKIRILDPACGSGSFLIVAYQRLLDWHLEYYLKLKRPPKDTIIQNAADSWQLSIAERKRILCNNIFGTDIDGQAVEVTKLSLLLKVLEGENQASIDKQLHLERILPDLDSNIKSGNSLIGSDFYMNKALPKLHEDDHERINVFDWDEAAGFPAIMKDGGFDAIIGNPPYISARNEGFKDYEKTYFYKNFHLHGHQLNTYTMFVELGLKLLKKNGKFGYIIPNKWLTIPSMQEFRKHILSNTGNIRIVNYDYQVFNGAAVDTSTLIFEKTQPSVAKIFKASKGEEPKLAIECDQKSLIDREAIPFDKKAFEDKPIWDRMNQFKRLRDYALVKAGIIAYGVGEGKPKQTEAIRDKRKYHSDHQKDKSYRKYLDSNDVKRYEIDWTGQWIKYGENLARRRAEHLFESAHILVRQIPAKPPYSICAAITDDDYINDANSMIIQARDSRTTKIILGLLNSKIISLWFNATYQKLESKTQPQFKLGELANFPMALDSDVADKIFDKVGELMKLTSKFKQQKNSAIDAKIKKLNDELDALAYQAYGMSDEDITFIETTIKSP